MVELAEFHVMNKKMLKKLKRHHGRHSHVHGEEDRRDGDVEIRGAMAPTGNEIVVVLRGKHHHHHHHYYADPSTLATNNDVQEGETHSKKHHRRGRHGRVGHRVIEGLRGLKHHVKRHHHYMHQHLRGLGLDFNYQQQHDTEAAAAAVTPTAPQAELMMKNLSLAEDKEENKP